MYTMGSLRTANLALICHQISKFSQNLSVFLLTEQQYILIKMKVGVEHRAKSLMIVCRISTGSVKEGRVGMAIVPVMQQLGDSYCFQLEQIFTAHMPLLMATNIYKLSRRRHSSLPNGVIYTAPTPYERTHAICAINVWYDILRNSHTAQRLNKLWHLTRFCSRFCDVMNNKSSRCSSDKL